MVNAYKIDNGKVVQIEQKLTPRPSAAVARNSLGWAPASGPTCWADGRERSRR